MNIVTLHLAKDHGPSCKGEELYVNGKEVVVFYRNSIYGFTDIIVGNETYGVVESPPIIYQMLNA